MKELVGGSVEKPDHISSSQIELGQCPYKYYRLRLLKDIENSSEAMSIGSAVHEIVFLYTHFCKKNKIDSDFDEMNKIIDKVFNKYQNKISESSYIDIRKNALEFGERGINFESIGDCEERRIVEFEPGKKIHLIIDRTDSYMMEGGSALDISDYKNTMKIFTKSDVEKLPQLNIYKYIGCKFLYPGFDLVRTGIYHTRYNFPRYSDRQKVAELEQEFENTHKYLCRQWDRLIVSDDYHPKKCAACWAYGGCAVMEAKECPLYTDAEVKKMKLGDIDGKVRAYRKMDIDIKSLGSQIREFFKNNPVKEIDGKDTGYDSSESYNYDLSGFVDYAKKFCIPFSGLSLSKTAVEKSIKKILPFKGMTPGELDDMKAMRLETASSSFKY
jgi:hypothetical protein